MGVTQIVKNANGTAISVNGIIIDPTGAANTNTLVFNSATNTFAPGAGGGASTGNWTFSGNNADLTGAATMGIGLTTATAITLGKTGGGVAVVPVLALNLGLDANGAVALPIGTGNATSVTIGRVGVNTAIGGTLSVGGNASAPGASFLAAGFDQTGAGAMLIGQTNATAITIGKSGVVTAFPASGIATAQTVVASLQNNQAASAGTTQQFSPGLEFVGHAWNTGSLADKSNAFLFQMQPVSGSSTKPQLAVYRSADGGAYSKIGYFDVDPTYGGIGLYSSDGTASITTSAGAVVRLTGGNTSMFFASGHLEFSGVASTVGPMGGTATGGLMLMTNGITWATNVGYAYLKIVEVNNNADSSDFGIITLSGHTDGLADGYELVADTGGVTANQVVVFSGAKKVAAAAATANLTTWAGVAITTAAAAARTVVACRGRVYVKYTGTVAAGDVLTTSGTTAGSVATNNAATGRQAIGVAMEAGGATVTNYVQMMMG